MKLIAASLCFLVSSVTLAQDLSDFRKILLPAYTPGSIVGANGSRFSTELDCYTVVDTLVYAAEPLSNGPASFIVQPAQYPLCRTLDYGPPRSSGRFFHVEREKADQLAVQYVLRSSDASEETADQMTALPVVVEPAVGSATILSIPVRPIIMYPDDRPAGHHAGYEYRIRLRVYDWEGDGTNRVTVQPYHQGHFGVTGALTPTTMILNQRDGDDPTFAWYGELPLEWCFPFSLHTPCMELDVRLEIIAESENLRFWPFVTVTDNRTQHVTVFAPQP